MRVVIVAPMMAPTLVNISRNMAIRTFAILSLTYADAEPLDVAITLTMPEAIASFTGMPKSTMIGMRMLAPPSPVREPMKPTGMEIKRRENMLKVTGGFYHNCAGFGDE